MIENTFMFGTKDTFKVCTINNLGKICGITDNRMQILTQPHRSILSKLTDLLLIDPISRNIVDTIIYKETIYIHSRELELVTKDIFDRKIITSGICCTAFLLYYFLNISIPTTLITFYLISLLHATFELKLILNYLNKYTKS